MLSKKKFLSIASAGVALVAIAGSAFAATTASTHTTDATAQSASNQVHEKHDHSNQELLTLLGIDQATLKQDFQAGQSLADIASAKSVDEQKVIDLLVDQQSQRIDKAVSAGKLTQAQADQKKADIATEVKKRVEQKGGFGEEHRRGHEGGELKDVATILGTTPQDLQTQLKAGQTIAQIAQTKGIAETDLINQLLQKDKDRLTKMVEKPWNQQKDDAETKDDVSTTATATATQSTTAPTATDTTTSTPAASTPAQ